MCLTNKTASKRKRMKRNENDAEGKSQFQSKWMVCRWASSFIRFAAFVRRLQCTHIHTHMDNDKSKKYRVNIERQINFGVEYTQKMVLTSQSHTLDTCHVRDVNNIFDTIFLFRFSFSRSPRCVRMPMRTHESYLFIYI